MMKWAPLSDEDLIYFDIFSDFHSQLSDTEDDKHHVITSRCYCRGMMLKEVGIPRMPHRMKSRDMAEDLMSLDTALKMLPKRKGRGRAKMLEEREDHFDLRVGGMTSLHHYLHSDQASSIDSSSTRDGMSETSSMFGDCELSDSNTDDASLDSLLSSHRTTNIPVHPFRKPIPVQPFSTESINDFPSLRKGTKSRAVDSDSSSSSANRKPSSAYGKRGRTKANSVRTLENNTTNKSNHLRATADIFIPKQTSEKHDMDLVSGVRNRLRPTADIFIPKQTGKKHDIDLVSGVQNSDRNGAIENGCNSISNLGNKDFSNNSFSNHRGNVIGNHDISNLGNKDYSNNGGNIGNHDISNLGNKDYSSKGISNNGGNGISKHSISNNGGNVISNHNISNNGGNGVSKLSLCNHGENEIPAANGNSDSGSDTRNISWNLSGHCVIQLEGVPLTADLCIMEETLKDFGQLLDSECCVVGDCYALRYRFSNEEECEWLVTYLHNTDMLYPDSQIPLICFRV